MIIAMISCGGNKDRKGNTSDSTKSQVKDAIVNTVKAGTLDDAKQLISKFMIKGADYAKLTNSLKPTLADANALFAKEEYAKKAFDYITKIFEQINKKKDYIQPKDGEIGYTVIPATVKDIKEGTGNASEFPGGYKKISSKLKDNNNIYLIKFLKKGEKDGSTFHSLVFVNNHWVIFFKVWKGLR